MQLDPITLAMPDRIAKVYNSIERPSFDIRAEADDDSVEIRVYGFVGGKWDEDGITAGGVADVLAKNRGKRVTVRINSPGGLAWDGITIHNALVKHDGPVETIIEGMAGSAATLIAVAGRPAKIFDNASFLVHKASGLAWGNSDLMIEMAEFLDKVDNQIARTYASRTGQSVDIMLRHLAGTGKKDGTVFNAQQAKRAGYVDEIVSLKREAGDVSNDASDVTLVEGKLREQYEIASEAEISTALRLMEIDPRKEWE